MKLVLKPLCFAALAALPLCVFSQVTVTTGAGYVKMVGALSEAYRSATGAQVEEAYGGNIGQMLAQVESGGHVNVVISDATSLKKFAKSLSEGETRLGETHLILAWRKGLELKSPEDLKDKSVEKVAMPDPKAAVYGRAGAEFLKNSGLEAEISSKINVVSTVPQVLSYLKTGDMDAGFVNELSARQGAKDIGGSLTVTGNFTPIVMVAKPVKGAETEKDVKAFLEWLSGDAATKILEKYGVRR